MFRLASANVNGNNKAVSINTNGSNRDSRDAVDRIAGNISEMNSAAKNNSTLSDRICAIERRGAEFFFA